MKNTSFFHSSFSTTCGRRSFLKQVVAWGGVATCAHVELQAAPLRSRQSSSPPEKGRSLGLGRGKLLMVKEDIVESKDQVTGVRVLRLAGGDFDNVHPYFTSTSFFGDAADQVVFFSNRSGRFELYLLEIHSGRLVQLTEGSEISPSGACLGRTGQLFYFDGPELHCLKIEGMKDQVLYRVPTGFEAHLPTCTADGRYVAFAYKERIAQSTETNRIYSTMAETYFQRPRSVIMRIDSSNGEAVAAWGEQTWISHVIIHPTDPNLILFCHEGGSTNVTQRMWTVDLNEHLARQAKPLYLQKPGESCVHEYFTRQGDVGFQYTLESGEQREEFNAFIRPNGTWIRQYRLPGARSGHMQSNSDNSLVVGDCGYLGPGDKDGNRYMSLMTHVNGRVVVRRLCQHRSSWKTQNSHPHPVFSPDDKWVLFNSDERGHHNVYMAEVASIR